MPLPNATGWNANNLARFGALVALILAGCSDSDAPSGGTGRAPRSHHDAQRLAPILPGSVDVAPPEVPSLPVPQDPAAQDRARAALLRRLHNEITAAYDRDGQRSWRWDLLAREALARWEQMQVRPVYGEMSRTLGYDRSFAPESFELGEDQVLACKAASKAIVAGCNDPLIHYVFARLSYGECDAKGDVTARSWIAAANGMRASNYPADLRAQALVRASAYLSRQAYNRTVELPQAEEFLSQALALIPEVARESNDNAGKANTLYHLGTLLVDACSRLPGQKQPGLEKAVDKINAVLAADGVSHVQRLLLSGDSCCRLAWLRRGHDVATHVSADDWDRFDTLVGAADDAFAEAWELDPNCPDTARLMISIATWRGQNREQMESWFQRAMRQNGDDYRACLAKLEYLEPRWHGSEPEMLAFGRECLRTQNWEGRLPFILIEAHRHIAKNLLLPLEPGDKESEYLSRPYVWNDIRTVYEEYVARHPESRFDKSCYAKLAARAGHYDVANRMFKELGTGYWRNAFQGNEYLKLSSKAREHEADPTRAKVEKAPRVPPPGGQTRPPL